MTLERDRAWLLSPNPTDTPEDLLVARDFVEQLGYRWATEHTPGNPWKLRVYVAQAPTPGRGGVLESRHLARAGEVVQLRSGDWRLTYWASERASTRWETYPDALEAVQALDRWIREGKVYAYQPHAAFPQPLAVLLYPPKGAKPR